MIGILEQKLELVEKEQTVSPSFREELGYSFRSAMFDMKTLGASFALSMAFDHNVRSKRGMGMVIGVVVFIAVAISIAIGYIVLATTVNSATTAAVNLTSSQSVNLNSIAVSVTGAFLLLTVLPVVLAAALIIGALFLFMRLRGGGGESLE